MVVRLRLTRRCRGGSIQDRPKSKDEVLLPFGGVEKSGNGYPSAREAIEAVTERTAWTMNNSRESEMAQGLSADITMQDD